MVDHIETVAYTIFKRLESEGYYGVRYDIQPNSASARFKIRYDRIVVIFNDQLVIIAHRQIHAPIANLFNIARIDYDEFMNGDLVYEKITDAMESFRIF